MITKLVVKDNKKAPLRYLVDLDNFKNGTEYEFKPGVNIIVGENGCGKSTLLKLLKAYLLVDYTDCGRGSYNCNINNLRGSVLEDNLLDGVDVYADYDKNTFRLSHAGEKTDIEELKSSADFAAMMDQNNASTGESVLIAINYLFDYMFSKDAKLKFDYKKECKNFLPSYVKYVDEHRVECEDEFTVLMDEPDRNLSLKNINSIKGILSFHKERTQLIVVVHNPLLIYALDKVKDINWIQMTPGYIRKVKQQINKLIK